MAVYNDSRAFKYVYPDYRSYLNGPVLAVSCEFVQNVIEQSYDYEPIETKMIPYKPHKTNISDMPDDILRLISSYLVMPVYKLNNDVNINGWNNRCYDDSYFIRFLSINGWNNGWINESYFWNIFYENLLKTGFTFIDGKYIEKEYVDRTKEYVARKLISTNGIVCELRQIPAEDAINMFKYDKQTYVQDIQLVADALYRLSYE